MRTGNAGLGSLIAAGVLAFLTVAVFWVLQDYGPESALRKFHRAAVNRNLRELSRLSAPGSYQEAVNDLAYWVDTYARNGGSYQLVYVKRENKRVLAQVAYRFPNRQMVPTILWVVQKYPGGWRVDVNQTEAIRQQMQFGF